MKTTVLKVTHLFYYINPQYSAIRRSTVSIINKCNQTFNIHNQLKFSRPKSLSSEDQTLHVSITSGNKKLYPYKIQNHQELAEDRIEKNWRWRQGTKHWHRIRLIDPLKNAEYKRTTIFKYVRLKKPILSDFPLCIICWTSFWISLYIGRITCFNKKQKSSVAFVTTSVWWKNIRRNEIIVLNI